MIKKYYFDYDHNASCTLVVDTEVFTEDFARELLDFFTWDYDEDENPIDEYMKKLAVKCISLATFENYTAYGVIQEFNELEGFPKLDGTSGIILTQVNDYEFMDNSLYVKISELDSLPEVPQPIFD